MLFFVQQILQVDASPQNSHQFVYPNKMCGNKRSHLWGSDKLLKIISLSGLSPALVVDKNPPRSGSPHLICPRQSGRPRRLVKIVMAVPFEQVPGYARIAITRTGVRACRPSRKVESVMNISPCGRGREQGMVELYPRRLRVRMNFAQQVRLR